MKKQDSNAEVSALEAIPLNAVLVFEVNNVENFIGDRNENNIWNQLKSVDNIAKADSFIVKFDSVVQQKQASDLFNNRSMYMSMHLLGNKTYEYLLLMSIDNDGDRQRIKDLISDTFESDAEVVTRKYNDEIIYDIQLGTEDSKLSFSLAITKSLVIVGMSPVIVESTIRQLSSDVSLLGNSTFAHVKNTAGKNVDVNLYVNYDMLPVYASAAVSDKLKKAYRKKRNLAGWAALDWNLKSNYILLNGFVSIKDHKDYLNMFIEQGAVDFEIYEHLPANTSMFWCIGINNLESYLKSYRTFLSQNERLTPYKNELDNCQKIFDADVIESLSVFFENEMALVFTDINSLDVDENTFVVIHSKSQSLAKEQMLGLLDSYASKAKIDFSSLVYEYSLDKETKYKIYRMPKKGIPEAVFGEVFSYCEANYFTFYDNYLIFGNSIKSLAKYIHPVLLQKTLSNDSDFRDFADNLSDEYNFYFYSNISKAFDLFPEFLDNSIKTKLMKNADVFKTFESVGYQFQSSNKMLYSNLYVNYNPENEDKPRTVWESFLDSIVAFKPKLVESHNTSEKRILVQDRSNNLYMLNKAGRILWKKHLPEQINSEIYIIDFYKNEKLQYAFSSANYLYVIDRIGNFVEHYPIKLPSPTQAGLSLFDYESNRNYRLVVPCENKRVYLFDTEGKTIDGWDFGKTDNVVTQPVQFFRIDKVDYLLMRDRFNTYILDRRGNVKVEVKEKFEHSQNNQYHLAKIGGNECFLTTDKEGNLKQIYLDGKVKTVTLEKQSAEHYFDYQDIDGDMYGDYVFLDGDELKVFGHNKKEMFEYDFESKISKSPVIYDFGAKNIKIGVVDQQKNKIYLINNNGTLYDGFPLLGTTRFSIGHFKKNSRRFNLVVGSDENFLYNYEVK